MDKTEIVQAMQDYIEAHRLDDDFSMDQLYESIGYSKRHGDRMFAELLQMTPAEYVKAVRLTESADELLHTDRSVLDIALDSRFHSHEGFLKAFKSRFHISPARYRQETPPIPLFTPHPVIHYNLLFQNQEETNMNESTTLCMISPVERPKRKLLFQRSKKAVDYISYCQEMGCSWEGLLNSIPSKFDICALLELPAFLRKEGYSAIAAGVELPADYSGFAPEGYELAELPECTMLYFQTEPYEKEEDFPAAIEAAYHALEKYDAERYGYELAYDAAPGFNFGADTGMGGKIAVPVRRIGK